MLLGMLLADHDFLYEWLKAKQSSYNTRATNQKDVVGELVYQGWRGTVRYLFWSSTYFGGIFKCLHYFLVLVFILFILPFSKDFVSSFHTVTVSPSAPPSLPNLTTFFPFSLR